MTKKKKQDQSPAGGYATNKENVTTKLDAADPYTKKPAVKPKKKKAKRKTNKSTGIPLISTIKEFLKGAIFE